MTNEETPPHEYDGNEILDPLLKELDSRLERRPSARDRLAIRTALGKAIARAHARGMAFTSQEVEFPDFGDAEVDLWAEEYPERTSEGPPEKPPEVGAAVRDLADALGNAVASGAQELAKLLRGPGDR
ncbi:MAG: hypothetical protein ACTHMY_16575 [Solirubrobacteraceae bacterium]